MRIDRRGFFRILGAAVASVSGTASTARAAKGSLEIHRETRKHPFRSPWARAARNSSRCPCRSSRIRRRGGWGFPLRCSSPCSRWPRPPRVTTPGHRLRRSPFLSRSWGGCSISRTESPASSKPEAQTILLRSAPSAGALYAGEVYVVAERVQGLAKGVLLLRRREPRARPAPLRLFSRRGGSSARAPERARKRCGRVPSQQRIRPLHMAVCQPRLPLRADRHRAHRREPAPGGGLGGPRRERLAALPRRSSELPASGGRPHGRPSVRCTPSAVGQGAAQSPGLRTGASWSSSACPRISLGQPCPSATTRRRSWCRERVRRAAQRRCRRPSRLPARPWT